MTARRPRRGKRSPRRGSDRPGWRRSLPAFGALHSFMLATDYKDDMPDAITDLIADLGHACDLEGFNFEVLLQRATAHWRAERPFDTEL